MISGVTATVLVADAVLTLCVIGRPMAELLMVFYA